MNAIQFFDWGFSKRKDVFGNPKEFNLNVSYIRIGFFDDKREYFSLKSYEINESGELRVNFKDFNTYMRSRYNKNNVKPLLSIFQKGQGYIFEKILENKVDVNKDGTITDFIFSLQQKQNMLNGGTEVFEVYYKDIVYKKIIKIKVIAIDK